MRNTEPVLYAEDDENDVFFMERAFERLEISHPLRTVADGQQALAYLAGEGSYANRERNPLPCLVILDLGMAGKSGFDVLKWIRSQPKLGGLPVVALTSSNQETEIHRAYQLGANGFLIKPGDLDGLVHTVKGIQQFWLSGSSPSASFIDVSKS